MSREMFDLALSKYGMREIPDLKHNQEIIDMFHEIGQTWVNDDETAWCSMFMNWLALRSGKERTGRLNARSWLSIGTEIIKPEVGDVVVFWRSSPGSWKGHVGMYVNEINSMIYTLGGNQDNMVNIKGYVSDRLLGYRRLRNA
jgi:uncharacterized protein (TIGR02594 family)